MIFSKIKKPLLILAAALSIGATTSFAQDRPAYLSKGRKAATKYDEPTHDLNILTKWGDITSVSATLKKDFYKSPDLSKTIDIELEGKHESFDLDNSKNEEYDLSSFGITFFGNYRKEIDGELGWILPYLTIEPKFGLSYLDLSIKRDGIRKDEDFVLGKFGIAGNLFFERDATTMYIQKKGKLTSDDYMDKLSRRHRNKKPERFINPGLDLEKIVNFSGGSINDQNITYFKDIDNEPFTIKAHINIDDVYNLSYAHSFGRHDDNNEIWLDYFRRVKIPLKNNEEYRTHNRLTIGYTDDYGARDIFYTDIDVKFLRCEIDFYSDQNDRRNRYLNETNLRLDSTGGGRFVVKMPLPDYLMKRIPYGQEIGFLRDDCSVDHNNELTFTAGFERKTYDDADANNSIIGGFGWKYVRRPKE